MCACNHPCALCICPRGGIDAIHEIPNRKTAHPPISSVAQGRRTSVHAPRNALPDPSTGYDAVVVIAACNASSPTQAWSYLTVSAPTPSLLFLAVCNASDPAQQWEFAEAGAASRPVTPADSGDSSAIITDESAASIYAASSSAAAAAAAAATTSVPAVVGAAAGSAIRNVATGQCVDASPPTGQWDPALTLPCTGGPSQSWTLDAASAHVTPASLPTICLDVYNFGGPEADVYACKPVGQADSNQRWAYNASSRQLRSLVQPVPPDGGVCLAATTGGAIPGVWTTTTRPVGHLPHSERASVAHQLPLDHPEDADAVDSASAQPSEAAAVPLSSAAQPLMWCLESIDGVEAGWTVTPCNWTTGRTLPAYPPSLVGPPPPPGGGGPANYSLGGIGYNNQFGASGPWPHSRYLGGGGGAVWTIDVAAAGVPGGMGTSIRAADGLQIIDDDLVGGVRQGGAFCLDVRTMGMLEGECATRIGRCVQWATLEEGGGGGCW